MKNPDRFDLAATEFMVTMGRFLSLYRKSDPTSRREAVQLLRDGMDAFRGVLHEEVPHDGEIIHVDFKNRGNTGKA